MHRAYTIGTCIWVASVVALFIGDRASAYVALGVLAYSAVLVGFTLWLIPRSDAARESVLVALPKSRVLAVIRWAIVAVDVAFVVLYGIAYGGIEGGIYVPVATPFIEALLRWQLPLLGSAQALFNFAILALLPGLLLVAMGTAPRELGLTKSARGTLAATAGCLLLPIVFIVVGFARGSVTVVRLIGLVVHNLFSNGFSEEFWSRGVVFSHLRSIASDEWALIGQAIVFALLHTGSTIAEEHYHWVLIFANVIALNGPLAIALGVMALRGRSLVLPTIVHISIDTMAHVL